MKLLLSGHDFHFETENLCRVFFPYERITVLHTAEDVPGEPEETVCRCLMTDTGDSISYFVSLFYRGQLYTAQDVSAAVPSSRQERLLVVCLFRVLTQATEYFPKWGILTGVHPIKLFSSTEKELGTEGAKRYFTEELFVSPQKAEIAARTAHTQQEMIRKSGERSFSLYASIPFCPTRCSYCSFVSQTVERSARLIPQYVDLLCRELEETARIADHLHLELADVYIGGGTPTTLSAEQLTQLITCIRQNFDSPKNGEFTVEAGRPDTITEEKLLALKAGGVTRISINPQSLNDLVLQNIGRRHTAQETLDKFLLARKLGFDNINTDLIVGLPGDSIESFRHSLDTLIDLRAENITVHSLALKHAANMMQQDVSAFHRDGESAARMLEYADEALTAHGYAPYYLYRQSRMVGNLENTGWSIPGRLCGYNVYTMDEIHTVLACGAGGVTKVKDPYSDRLERIFNFKYSYEYVSRFAELIERKAGIEKLYEQFWQQLP